MNGDSEQNEEHPESRQQPENKLQSIRDMNRAIREGDEKYIDRLDVLADLLSDSNANLKKMIGIGTSLENHLREIRVGIAAIVANTSISDEDKEIGNEIKRIFEDQSICSESFLVWLKEQRNHQR